MEDNIEQPRIKVSYKDINPSISDNYAQRLIDDNIAVFFSELDIIVLSYGDFAKGLLKKYNRTIEKQTCITISHEIIHWILYNDLNIKVCARFDNIAKSLAEYGVY